MIAQDLYRQLILNLESAHESSIPLSPQTKTSLHTIGSFLRSRSSEFEVLENQEDISVFISVCKSNQENLVLVFNYFLSDSPVMQNKKESASKFLKTMLGDFDKSIKSFKDTGNQTRPKSEYKVSNSNYILDRTAPAKKASGR